MQDSEIISAILEPINNQKIITKFYDMYLNDFIYFSMSHFKVKADSAKGIYQDAQYILISNFRDGRIKELSCSLKTYLLSIGRNLIINEQKRQGKQTEFMENHSSFALPDLDEIEEENDHSHKSSIVRDAVSALKDPCKTILTLFYYDKKKLEDILTVLPNYSSKDTLKNQKSKCINRLEKLVKDEFSKNKLVI